MRAPHLQSVSPQLSTKIEEVSHQLAEFNDDEDERLTIKDVATKLEVTTVTIQNWIASDVIPSEKIAGKRYIRLSVAEAVRELRELHGTRWSDHAVWNQDPKDQKDVEVVVGEEPVPESLPQKLLRRAEELREERQYQAAAELYSVFCSHFDFTEV